MDADTALLYIAEPWRILSAQSITPDPWQEQFLLSHEPRVLLNCCRQAGKSTTVAALALHTALFSPRALVLLLSPTQRQSYELFRKVLDAYRALGSPVPAVSEGISLSRLELTNGSRIVGLPAGHGDSS